MEYMRPWLKAEGVDSVPFLLRSHFGAEQPLLVSYASIAPRCNTSHLMMYLPKYHYGIDGRVTDRYFFRGQLLSAQRR
jgi:hypothetical protein